MAGFKAPYVPGWNTHGLPIERKAMEEVRKRQKKEKKKTEIKKLPMIITFATQKGGTGKTTLAITFANYISVISKRKINVFDFDYQKSFYQKWKEDEEWDLPKLYDV